MINLRGIVLSNPIVASSGALAFGRAYPWERPLVWAGHIRPSALGAVVTKTLTAQPRQGNWRGWNPWQVLRRCDGGWVNAIGLTNPGIDWFIAHEFPLLNCGNLIVSVAGATAQEMVDMVQKLNGINVLAIELNLSCPNSPEWIQWKAEPLAMLKMLEAVQLIARHPLIAKIGYCPSVEKRLGIGQVLRCSEIQVVSMINTIPFAQLFPNQQSPLPLGGGVSGQAIKHCALEQVRWYSQHSGFAIIGGGGISTEADVKQFLEAGAAAVSIGSAHILQPWISTHLAKKHTWVG